MAKVNLTPVTGGYNLSAINNNFEKVEKALNEGTLWRNNPLGEPNQLESNVDANGKRIYNLPEPVERHEAATLDTVNRLSGGSQDFIDELIQLTADAGEAADEAKDAALAASSDADEAQDARDVAVQAAIEAASSAASVDVQNLSTDYYSDTEPSVTFPGMAWADRANQVLWRRNDANDQWIFGGDLFPTGDLSEDVRWLGTHIGDIVSPFEAPPTDNPKFRYILLTAGHSGAGDYNEGVLTGESVSGSSPNIDATAVIDFPSSLMDGLTVTLINTTRHFLRPGTLTDVPQNSQNASHTHTGTTNTTGSHTHNLSPEIRTSGQDYESVSSRTPEAGGTSFYTTSSSGAHSHTVTLSSQGGDEARPRNYPKQYYMRIF